MDKVVKDELLKNIVEFYSEKWVNDSKAFKHNAYYAKKKNIPIESTACRYLNEQPLIFSDKRILNKRKLNELPYIITTLPLLLSSIFFYRSLSGEIC